MIKILTVVGARPQIIKASAISRAIRLHFVNEITEVIVHTGQHYDYEMSDIFFNQLQIPKPSYNLNVGSSSHGAQTADMIKGIEDILFTETPDYVLVYGDTNSTLSGALAASKLHIPIVHIEAGLRSKNKIMPEEINRILTDHCSSFLYPPTETGYNNLIEEGFIFDSTQAVSADNPKVSNFGDVMLDNSIFFSKLAMNSSNIMTELNIDENNFILTTIHRDLNTDNIDLFSSILQQLIQLHDNTNIRIVFPIHPRTKKSIELLDPSFQKEVHDKLLIINPVPFLDMILLEKKCSLIITDSGGVQKEAYFFGKTCLVVRQETEWKEIINVGMAKLVKPNEICNEALSLLENIDSIIDSESNLFGIGDSAQKILKDLLIQSKYN